VLGGGKYLNLLRGCAGLGKLFLQGCEREDRSARIAYPVFSPETTRHTFPVEENEKDLKKSTINELDEKEKQGQPPLRIARGPSLFRGGGRNSPERKMGRDTVYWMPQVQGRRRGPGILIPQRFRGNTP